VSEHDDQDEQQPDAAQADEREPDAVAPDEHEPDAAAPGTEAPVEAVETPDVSSIPATPPGATPGEEIAAAVAEAPAAEVPPAEAPPAAGTTRPGRRLAAGIVADVQASADVLAEIEAAALAAAEQDPGAATERRYARPGADRLSEEALEEIAARSTGATAAAFFDLDKTIIARSSTLVMGRRFLRDGLLGPSTVIKTLYAQAVYQLVGADHERMEQARTAALELTRGWEAERVERLVKEALEEVIAPLAYREALDQIEEHRRAGRDVWIVSSGGEEVVEPFAHHLGIHDVIATRAGIDEDGRYDGTLEFYAYAAAKATAVRQIAEVRGYDLTNCFAYSDSVTDLPMLSAVGNPVAVNPDRELRAAAQAMAWDIRDFVAPVGVAATDEDDATVSKRVVAGLAGAALAALVTWRYVRSGETPNGAA
jgi:HAD superfamily hydrolase (TIGR01490 family)